MGVPIRIGSPSLDEPKAPPPSPVADLESGEGRRVLLRKLKPLLILGGLALAVVVLR